MTAPATAPAPSRRRRPDATRRTPVLLVVVAAVAAVVAAGSAVDRRDGVPPEAAAAGPTEVAPVAPAADALGSTWYCAAGADDQGEDDDRVVVANLGSEPVDVVVTAIPGAPFGTDTDAEPAAVELTVDPRSREDVSLADLVDAPFVSAVVEAGRGEVVVEHGLGLSSPDPDVAPCASSSSPTWYLAAAATTRDATAQLVLFNPFPDDAVVDITFVTPEGLRSPAAFSGFIVPGRRVSVVDVGEVVSRHPNVATSIVARAGRLVVERVQRFDGTDGAAGLAVTPAAPEPSPVWHVPDGLVADGVTEVVTIFNPTDDPAEVDLEVDLDPSTDASQPVSVEPFSQTIAPHGYAQIDVTADGRVPAGRGHSLTARSQNGVGIVAERWIRTTAPAARTGFAATLGSPVAATRWLSGVGGATPDQAEFLVLVNPAAEGIARVSITAATPSQDLPIAGLEDVEVPAQGRIAIDLGQYLNRADLLLVVESSIPIVAERGIYPATGLTASILLPSSPTATLALVDPGSVVVP